MLNVTYNFEIIEEVILAEERTTEEEKMHIMEGNVRTFLCYLENNQFFSPFYTARRRAAAKRKKLKNLGKSKSTDTEEEDCDDDCADDGKYLSLAVNLETIGD